MPFQHLDKAHFAFGSFGMPADTFAVARLDGEEALSRPYRFELGLVANRSDIDLDQIIERPASLKFFGSKGQGAKVYHGFLAEFEVFRQVDDVTFYRAVLVPRFWQLSRYRISEVYLGEKTTPDLVELILRNAAFSPGIDYEMRLKKTYRPRSFVCQYQESHLDFISRWLEWEGIYYWFAESHGHEKIVFADDQSVHENTVTPLVYRPSGQLDTTYLDDTLHAFACRRTPLPAKVIVQDHNYRKSPLEVKAEAVVSPQGLGEVMYYGENVRTGEEAEKIARLRAEELICRGKLYQGEASAPGLRSGFLATVDNYFRVDFNRCYLVTKLRHQGSQAAVLLGGIDRAEREGELPFYRVEFTAIPSDVQFRPERVTPKPRLHGTMNATVDGEGSGKYAELNEYGQYKVQLPFDKTDKLPGKASAWLRMASPYAGGDYGMHMPVHKGAEVLLSFTDGDPDQPVIIGAVPNSENRNMVTNANQTQSVLHTGGGNRIAIEDQEDKRRILLHSPTQDTFIRIGAPNDPWKSRWQRPVLQMPILQEVIKGLDDHGDTGVIAEAEGIAQKTKGMLDIYAAAQNVVIAGEVSQTILGASVSNYAGLYMANYGGIYSANYIFDFFESIVGFKMGLYVGGCYEKKFFGFKEGDVEIEVIKENISTVNTKISVVDTKVGQAVNEISDAKNKFEDIELRVETTEANMRHVGSEINAVNRKIEDVEEFISDHELLIQGIDTKVAEVKTEVGTIGTRVQNAETVIKEHTTNIERAEATIRDDHMFVLNTFSAIIGGELISLG